MTPSLVDLVLLYLKETHPYWKFKISEGLEPSLPPLLMDAEHGFFLLAIFGDYIELRADCMVFEKVYAADPDFFGKLSKHVTEIKSWNNALRSSLDSDAQ